SFEPGRHYPMFRHRSATPAGGAGNGAVRSLGDNVTSIFGSAVGARADTATASITAVGGQPSGRGQPRGSAGKGRKQRQAQDAVRLGPKRYVGRSRGWKFPWRGWRTTGRKGRPYPGAIEKVNEVTPLLPCEGRRTAKDADEAAGKG